MTLAPVPPTRIDFTPEDRAWIAEHITEVLTTGRLTLGISRPITLVEPRKPTSVREWTGARFATFLPSWRQASGSVELCLPVGTSDARPSSMLRATRLR